MNPSQLYALGVSAGEWKSDPAQVLACRALDRIHHALLAEEDRPMLSRWWQRWRDAKPVRGLYLWGSVGRGKTFLTDLLIESLPSLPLRRWHFHRFMVEMHTRMRALPDTADTLSVIAKQLRDECLLLVLDEFFVTDIADAMILGRLLERLLAEGVCVVTTSNIAPSGLYADGLQRARFLPAIALIENELEVLKLDSAQDYRTRQLLQAGTYLMPLSAAHEAALEQCLHQLRAHAPLEPGPLRVNERDIAVRLMAEGVVLFDFDALCRSARSAADYIEIARDFHTVLIAGVPRLHDGDADAARRFVHLIDELYDRHVNVLINADAAPQELYAGGKLELAMQRTASRLIEMQSRDYLEREHRP